MVSACPVLRQMLGWHSSNGARWVGLNDNTHDLPLLAWLAHHSLAPFAGAASPQPGWLLEIDPGSGFPGIRRKSSCISIETMWTFAPVLFVQFSLSRKLTNFSAGTGGIEGDDGHTSAQRELSNVAAL